MIELALLICIPILFILAVKRPDRALLTWLFLSPLSQDKLILFGVNLRIVSFDRLAFLATALGLLASGRFRELLRPRFSKLEKSVIAFLIIFWLEAIIQFPPRDAFSMCMSGFDSFGIPFYLSLLVKYLLTRDGDTEAMEGKIAKTLAFVGLYCAAMSIFEAFTVHDLFPPPFVFSQDPDGNPDARGLVVGTELRTNGPFWVAEILGEYLSLILLFMIYRWRVKPPSTPGSRIWRRVTSIPYALLLLVGMYFTMYRNVWGGFIGGYSLRCVFTRRGRMILLAGGAAISLLLVLSYGSFRDSNFYQNRITNTENIYDRLGAWLYSFRAFSQHPFIGIGYGRLKHYIWSAQEVGDDLRVGDVPATFHPHNTVVALLGENGLLLNVPFLLLLWYFFGEVRACVRLAKTRADFEFGLFAVSGAFAMLAPHMTDRCLSWNKYNNLLFVFLALVAAHHIKLLGPEKLEINDDSLEPNSPSEESSEHVPASAF